MRLLGPGTPGRYWDSDERGTYDRSRDAEKRHQRALKRVFAGQPGGWKKLSLLAQVRARVEAGQQ